MNNEEIKRKREFTEEMARDIFIGKVIQMDYKPSDSKMREVASGAFEAAEYFYIYRRKIK